jgi:Cu(I)-responsive transcriptional regulator
MDEGMNIGQAAKATGISAKMIRYYEDTGLIGPVARTDAGYRIYSPRDIHTLGFIKRSRDMGFSVERIGELLALWRDRSRHSADVKRMASEHIDELRERINQLQEMVQTVQALVDCCAGDARPDCPILRDIETGVPLHGEAPPTTFGSGNPGKRKRT